MSNNLEQQIEEVNERINEKTQEIANLKNAIERLFQEREKLYIKRSDLQDALGDGDESWRGALGDLSLSEGDRLEELATELARSFCELDPATYCEWVDAYYRRSHRSAGDDPWDDPILGGGTFFIYSA